MFQKLKKSHCQKLTFAPVNHFYFETVMFALSLVHATTKIVSFVYCDESSIFIVTCPNGLRQRYIKMLLK